MEIDTISVGLNNAHEKNSKRSPKTLFKYTNMDYIESCILKGVYASRIDAVNDPFECDGIKYPALYRICCMTNSPKQMLLWAYYTNHCGCCVEFDVSNIDTNVLRPVEYIKSYSSHNNMSLDKIYDSLYQKGKEWEHENEYRAVYYKKLNKESFWFIDEKDNVYLKAPVKSVTFGLFSDKDASRFKTALELLKKHSIDAKKVRLANNKYALEYDFQFDLDLELELIGANNTYIMQKALNSLVEIAGSPDRIIPLDYIQNNMDICAGLQELENQKLIVLHYIRKANNGYQWYYGLTEQGIQYYLQHH